MSHITAQDFYCRHCGYSLRGLETPRCPECGHGFDPANPRTMSQSRRSWFHRHRWRICIGTLLLLLISYGSSYHRLVVAVVVVPPAPPTPTPLLQTGGTRTFGGLITLPMIPPQPKVALYRHGGQPAQVIFRPAHWLDRKLRPDFWLNYGVPADCVPAAKQIARVFMDQRLNKNPQFIAPANELRDLIAKLQLLNPTTPESAAIRTKLQQRTDSLRKAIDRRENANR